MFFQYYYNLSTKKRTPSYSMLIFAKLYWSLSATILQSNQIHTVFISMSRVNLSSVRIGWLRSFFLNDGKKETEVSWENKTKIARSVSNLSTLGIAEKDKAVDVRRRWGAPQKMFFVHSSDKKNHGGTYTKKEKTADVRRCWNKTALVNYLKDTF